MTEKMSGTARPAGFVDLELVKGSCSELVTFYPVGPCIAIDQEITVRYKLSDGFHAKTGDWIGLFQVGKKNPNKFLYIGFHWAPKHFFCEKKSLERFVKFNLSDFNLPVSSGKDSYYQFMYMTASEKLVGCSNIFQIRLYVPVTATSAKQPKASSVQKQPQVQEKSIVPFEFFHQKHALFHIGNTALHLCSVDLAARRCVIDSSKYPVSSRFAKTRGLQDWSKMTFPLPMSLSLSRDCSGCQLAKDIIRILHKRLYQKKQTEDNNSELQRQIENLKNEVEQLRSRELALQKALSDECKARQGLIQLNEQTQKHLLEKLGGIQTWLVEKHDVAKKVTINEARIQAMTASETQGRNRIHIYQSQKNAQGHPHMFHADITANTQVNSEADHHLETEPTEQSVLIGTKHESRDTHKVCNVEKLIKEILNKSKHHDTYSGSRIGLRHLFKENSDQSKSKEPAFEKYSGSNLSLRLLFGEHKPKKDTKTIPASVLNQYSGSHLTLRQLFDERLHNKKNNIASTSETYSGSNLTLSNLFSDRQACEFTSKKIEHENSSPASCYCHCRPEMLDKSKADNITSCKPIANVKPTDSVPVSVLKSAAKVPKTENQNSVQENNKKLSVCFQTGNEKDDIKATDNKDKFSKETINVSLQKKGKKMSKKNQAEKATKTEAETTKETHQPHNTLLPKKAGTPDSKLLAKQERQINSDKSTQTTVDTLRTSTRNMTKQGDGIQDNRVLARPTTDPYRHTRKAEAVVSGSTQTPTAVIPPSKSATLSTVAPTNGKQETLKDPLAMAKQAEISRDAKSASSLGRSGTSERGNEQTIASSPVMTSCTCKKQDKPATTDNLVSASRPPKASSICYPSNAKTIRTIETVEVSSMTQLTLIKDIGIVAIANLETTEPAINCLQKINADNFMPQVKIINNEDNKTQTAKSKSAAEKANLVDEATHPKSQGTQSVLNDADHIPKSFHLNNKTASTVRTRKPDCKTLPFSSVKSFGTESLSKFYNEIKKRIPFFLCTLFPSDLTSFKPELQQTTDSETTPVLSSNHVCVRPKQMQQKPCSSSYPVHSLAKLATETIRKYYKSQSEQKGPIGAQDTSTENRTGQQCTQCNKPSYELLKEAFKKEICKNIRQESNSKHPTVDGHNKSQAQQSNHQATKEQDLSCTNQMPTVKCDTPSRGQAKSVNEKIAKATNCGICSCNKRAKQVSEHESRIQGKEQEVGQTKKPENTPAVTRETQTVTSKPNTTKETGKTTGKIKTYRK